MIDILIEMPHNSVEARRQMLAECRAHYRGNKHVLMKIAEFDRDYRAEDTIYWYTKPCFLHQLVNRLLRWDGVMATYTFRYFIVELSERIRELATITKQLRTLPFCVYRGSIISREEVERLSVDTLVATRGFFSTSESMEVAKKFIGIDPNTNVLVHQNREHRLQYVLFEIEVDYVRSPKTIVADISAQSVLPEEREMIFDLGTTFVITTMTYDSVHNMWLIRMESSSKLDRLSLAYKLHTRTRLATIAPKLLFGRYLSDVSSKNREALEYFHRLLRHTVGIDEACPHIYLNIGRVYRVMGKYQHAMHYHQRARLLCRRTLPQSSFTYGCSLSGLGTLYCLLGDTSRALSFLIQAMKVHQSCLEKNHIEIAMNWNRLATAHWLAGNHKYALSLLSCSLDLHKRNLPEHHHCEAHSYHIMGQVYSSLGNNKQALDCYSTAITIWESMLFKNHHLVASTCYQLAKLYAQQEDKQPEALQYATRALRTMQTKLPASHPEAVMCVRLVDNLLKHV